MDIKKLIVPVMAITLLLTSCRFSSNNDEDTTDIFIDDTTNATASYSITSDKELVKGNTVKLTVSSKDFTTFESGKDVIAMQFSVCFKGMELVSTDKKTPNLPDGWNTSVTETEKANKDGRAVYMLDSDFQNPITDQTVAIMTFNVTEDNPEVYIDGIKIVCQLKNYQEFTCASYEFDQVKDVTVSNENTESKIDSDPGTKTE